MSAHSKQEAEFACDTCGAEHADRGMVVYDTCRACGKTWCPRDADGDDLRVLPCAGCEKMYHTNCMAAGEDEELRCAGCVTELMLADARKT